MLYAKKHIRYIFLVAFEKLSVVTTPAEYVILYTHVWIMWFAADGCIENCAQCTTSGKGKCDRDHCHVAYTYNTATSACEGSSIIKTVLLFTSFRFQHNKVIPHPLLLSHTLSLSLYILSLGCFISLPLSHAVSPLNLHRAISVEDHSELHITCVLLIQ